MAQWKGSILMIQAIRFTLGLRERCEWHNGSKSQKAEYFTHLTTSKSWLKSFGMTLSPWFWEAKSRGTEINTVQAYSFLMSSAVWGQSWEYLGEWKLAYPLLDNFSGLSNFLRAAFDDSCMANNLTLRSFSWIQVFLNAEWKNIHMFQVLEKAKMI